MFKKSVLICLAILFLVNFSYTPQTLQEDVFIIKGRMNWKDAFNEPFEIVFLVTYDTYLIGMTSQEEHTVGVSVTYIMEYLKADGYELSDIAIMVHNHFSMPFLSWGNGMVLKELRNRGFKGSFGVYHTPTDTIKWAERNED